MKRVLLLAFLVLPVMLFAGTSQIWNLYNESLGNDTGYQTANLEFKQAENTLNSMNSFWSPNVSIGTYPSITFSSTGIADPNANLNVDFLNVWGAKIGLSLPFSLSGWQFNWMVPTLSVTRNLFDENQATLLSDQATYYSSLWDLKSSEWSVFTDLVQNIFDWYYYSNLVGVYTQQVNTLRVLYDSTTDQTQKESWHQQLLTAQSALLGYKNSLGTLKALPASTPYSTALYEDAVTLVSTMAKKVVDSMGTSELYGKREDIKSLELQYDSAKKKAELWFLPYIPNPSLSFDLWYQPSSLTNETGFLKWSFSLSFDFSIYDGGANTLQSVSRKTDEQVAKLQLQNGETGATSSLEGLFSSLKVLNTNLENNDSTTLTDAATNLKTAQELYKKGFYSKEELGLAEYNYKNSLLSSERIRENILITYLEILQAEGAEID